MLVCQVGGGPRNKQPWEAQGFSKIALFLVPQRRLAPQGDNHPCGRRGSGTLKALVSQQPCQALLETAPGLRAGFWANPFVLQMKEASPYVPSIPLLGIYISKKIEGRVLKRYVHTHVHSSIHNSQNVDAI